MTIFDMEPLLHRLKLRYGPLFTLGFKSKPTIFIADHSFAHIALIQKGAFFSDRPKSQQLMPISKIFNSNAHRISSAKYGQTWRFLRRNLTSEMLHPSRFKTYSTARRWVLDLIVQRLVSQQTKPVLAMDHFRYGIFCLLVFMCFGDKLDEEKVKEIETLQRNWLLNLGRIGSFMFWPKLGRIFLGNRWKELIQVRKNQEDIFIPLIRARKKGKKQSNSDKEEEEEEGEKSVAYVDTLVDLQLPEEKRNLNESEIVSLCSEFLNAGTDTTATALEWIMANLVKYPAIQTKLYEEIVEIVGNPPSLKPSSDHMSEVVVNVNEEDIQKMPFLKAVVLEGLRRHPPAHFVLPHSVTEDVELGNFLIPKTATVNVLVAELGWDSEVWENPMEFKPERFLMNSMSTVNGGDGRQLFDITGKRGIKMMPFGAGRRICPGYGLALLHLEYFVANLIWYFEWTAMDGNDIDLSEKQEFTICMKNPLSAYISPRVNTF